MTDEKEHLPFAPLGHTLIFGPTGAGKCFCIFDYIDKNGRWINRTPQESSGGPQKSSPHLG